jgi:zinc protease
MNAPHSPNMTLAPQASRAARVQHVVSQKGISAWLVEDYAVPLVAVEFAFAGGSSQDAPGRMGSSVMLAALMDEGAGEMDAQPSRFPFRPIAILSTAA